MGNVEKNKQFHAICKRLRITDKNQIRRFHLYLQGNYRGVSNEFSDKELLEVGKEFLELEGGIKKSWKS